jgi:hypothetical protein
MQNDDERINEGASGTPGDEGSGFVSLDDMFYEAMANAFAENGEEPTEERIAEVTGEVIPKVVPELGEILIRQILRDAPSATEANRAERTRFYSVIQDSWGAAIDLLEVLVDCYYEFGRDRLVRLSPHSTGDRGIRHRVLGRLHARSVRTANEVLCLLKAGLADGAMGRWRTLHEISVVASVLATHAPELAERYLLHRQVRAQRAMRDYRRHQLALRLAPISAREQKVADRPVQRLVKRFGREFEREYGWAFGHVKTTAKHGPTFADLERDAELDKFRPIFGWASDSVHGGPKGLLSLGVPTYAVDEFLYAAGSTSGLSDPGQNTALSIGHFVGAVVGEWASIESLTTAHAMMLLIHQCCGAFYSAHVEVERKTRENFDREWPNVARRRKRR